MVMVKANDVRDSILSHLLLIYGIRIQARIEGNPVAVDRLAQIKVMRSSARLITELLRIFTFRHQCFDRHIEPLGCLLPILENANFDRRTLS